MSIRLRDFYETGHNATIEDLSLRVAEVVGIPLENAESLQVVHYAESQQYAPHFDAWDAATERGQRCMVKGGQRLVTCLLYLNDVEQGGSTSFPKLDLEVRVKKGQKWACNFWFREAIYQLPGTTPMRKATATPSQTFNRVI